MSVFLCPSTKKKPMPMLSLTEQHGFHPSHCGEVCGSQAHLCPSCPCCGLYRLLLLPKPLSSSKGMTEFPALEH